MFIMETVIYILGYMYLYSDSFSHLLTYTDITIVYSRSTIVRYNHYLRFDCRTVYLQIECIMYTVINKPFFRLLSNQNNFFQSLGIANILISMQSGHESIIFVFFLRSGYLRAIYLIQG